MLLFTIMLFITACSDDNIRPPYLEEEVEPTPETKEFVVNLTTKQLCRATDYCGVRSGRDVDKFQEMHLTPQPSEKVKAPGIAESPVNIECRVTQVLELGTHDMFLAEVVAVRVDDDYMDVKGRFDLIASDLVTY